MSNAALLIMDVQNGIVERLPDPDGPLLADLGRAAAAARAAKLPVIYVRVAFRAGNPEANPRNVHFGLLATVSGFGENDPETQVHPAVAPEDGDLIVIKKRVSAFAGSDLELLLRSLGIDHLVLTGISTSGVVLSTVRQASDLDYGLTVLSDGCADRDDEVHRLLIERIYPKQATVVTVDEWIATL